MQGVNKVKILCDPRLERYRSCMVAPDEWAAARRGGRDLSHNETTGGLKNGEEREKETLLPSLVVFKAENRSPSHY